MNSKEEYDVYSIQLPSGMWGTTYYTKDACLRAFYDYLDTCVSIVAKHGPIQADMYDKQYNEYTNGIKDGSVYLKKLHVIETKTEEKIPIVLPE